MNTHKKPFGKGLLLLLLALPLFAFADEDPHAKHRAMMKQKSDPAAESADVDLRDRQLVDQHGREMMFVSDVIGDDIVVMDFVYTTCTTICRTRVVACCAGNLTAMAQRGNFEVLPARRRSSGSLTLTTTPSIS